MGFLDKLLGRTKDVAEKGVDAAGSAVDKAGDAVDAAGDKLGIGDDDTQGESQESAAQDSAPPPQTPGTT